MSVKIHPQYLLDGTGRRRSVLLSIEEFDSIVNELESHAGAVVLEDEVLATQTRKTLNTSLEEALKFVTEEAVAEARVLAEERYEGEIPWPAY